MIKNDLFDYEPYKIYQDDQFFKFSLDSILLSEYVDKRYKDKKIVDLCCGNGAIPLILHYYGFNNLTGLELQKPIYDLAIASLKENKVDNINIINDDVNNVRHLFKSESFDIVTCNPPYFKTNHTSLINDNEIKAIARHEIKLDLDNLLKNAAYLLTNNGILYMVHRSERLFEIANISNHYHLTIKEVVFIASNQDNYDMVLIKLIKNGNDGVKIKMINDINSYKSYKNMFER